MDYYAFLCADKQLALLIFIHWIAWLIDRISWMFWYFTEAAKGADQIRKLNRENACWQLGLRALSASPGIRQDPFSGKPKGMTRPIVRSGQHQTLATMEKWRGWWQTWVRSQVPGGIRHICGYKWPLTFLSRVNWLVIDFKIIVKIGNSSGQVHGLPDDSDTDRITYLNWRTREGGDIYRSIESQTSKEMGLL